MEVVEGEEVGAASWEDWEVQLNLKIPTRILSEPQQAPALSLEIHLRKAAASSEERPALRLVDLAPSLLSLPSLGPGQVRRSWNGN